MVRAAAGYRQGRRGGGAVRPRLSDRGAGRRCLCAGHRDRQSQLRRARRFHEPDLVRRADRAEAACAGQAMRCRRSKPIRAGRMRPAGSVEGHLLGRHARRRRRAGPARRMPISAARRPGSATNSMASSRPSGSGCRCGAPPMAGDRPVDPGLRNAFYARESVRAAQYLGQIGDHETQSLFVRQIATDAKTDADHALANQLAIALEPARSGRDGRPQRDAERAERLSRQRLIRPSRCRRARETEFTIIHAIARQESQFDRAAVSHAGARGLMQLMPGTARETAGKLGHELRSRRADHRHAVQHQARIGLFPARSMRSSAAIRWRSRRITPGPAT